MTDNEYQIYWREQFQAAQREIAEMAMTQAVLVAALKEVEWVCGSCSENCPSVCPWCSANGWAKEPKHAPDCQRQLALERCKSVEKEA